MHDTAVIDRVPTMGDVTLRAATQADEHVLRDIYASTRADELAQLDWTLEQKAWFVGMQFDAQHRHYVEHYPDAAFLVIERDGVPVGRLYLHEQPTEVRIMDIALLPEARGLGIGTTLLRQVIADAAARGQAVSIHVEDRNPARQLYERLGFTPVEIRGVYTLMEIRRAPHDGAARA